MSKLTATIADTVYFCFDTYSAAVTHYGKQSQAVIAMEEMAELTKELSKDLRCNGDLGAILEEIADVEIMLEQLKIIYGNRAMVDRIRAEKLIRLADRIKDQEERHAL